jgi:alpha-L-arabinofuranosidase
VPGWTIVRQGQAEGIMSLDTNRPLKGAQPHSLRIEARHASPTSRFGVVNAGYFGMSFHKGAEYHLGFYARGDPSFKGKIGAVLEDKAGRSLCEPAAIPDLTSEWRRYTARLPAEAENHQGRFALYLDAPGTVWIDVVSLFPADTWAKRPNGLRADLVQMLRDLKPGFLRFPGGCVTEGLTLEQGFAWKKTLGDIAERPGVWNAMWGYRRSDGFGYHEMLQLCEDIGAAPIFCLNVGIACTIHTAGGGPCPESEVQRYVQDSVDAIAYANAPPTTPWGQVRAAQGHPEPFNLRYVNIGNELNCREYTERYPAFHNAIKAAFPEVLTIAYAPVGKPRAPVEMKDLHDYRNDDWFLKNLARFDNADRSGPRISNMELAVRNQTNHTLHNALLEAAYLLGLERNADLVRLVSYAPLFVNVNHPSPWFPSLIHFDNHRVYGTPSYYVQQLFMHSRPDRVVGTEVEAGPEGGLCALAGTDRDGVILKIVNLLPRERVVTIQMRGVGKLRPLVTQVLLTSGSEMDTNSLEQPRRVAPVRREVPFTGETLNLTLPKHVLMVLKFN